ncbi:MAG: hypothetical protein IPN33_06405 [Saprospiraceae bacterium]|nr:hypothetical protein [Saprospiraceae bacterium]
MAATPAYAQFQRIYGDGQDNYFHKVIPDGANNFYVIGIEDNHGVISHILSNGQLDWTMRMIDQCILLDAVSVFAGFGNPRNLMVVGTTLPFDQTNKSLLIIVTPNGGLLHSSLYDIAGNEGFVKIAARPNGDFAVSGFINVPGFSNNVILMEVAPTGAITHTGIFGNAGDNGYFLDVHCCRPVNHHRRAAAITAL